MPPSPIQLNPISTGGITNGLDLTAAYLRFKVQKELADMVCAMADIGDRSQDYDSGKAGNTLWWLWLIVRALVNGRHADKQYKKEI